MKCSVVIPTYNDAKLLKRCLEHLNSQKFESSFEVVIVDDGSIDDTKKILGDWKRKKTVFDLKVVSQKNQGRSVARNRGVKESNGDIVLFLGANILPSKNWLQVHKDFHQKNTDQKAMTVGFMTWTKVLGKDRFRRWLETSGIMFSFKGLKNERQTDFWHFYTGNISMKKKWFERFKFDESFKAYGWEDIMLGYEMLNKGGELYYLKNAKAENCRSLNKKDLFPNRMKSIGSSAVLFQQKYPKVNVVPSGFRLFIFKLISFAPVLFVLSCIKKEWGWYAESKKWFLEGVNT